MKHVAAEISGSTLQVFVEGISLIHCLRPLKEEIVQVQLLVYTSENHTAYHDMRYTDVALGFCRQELTVASLLYYMCEDGLEHPAELEFCNNIFYFRQWYPSAYLLSFPEFQENDLYRKFIHGMAGGISGSEIERKLFSSGKALTPGLEKLFSNISLEHLARKRFDSWHEKVVGEYERQLQRINRK